HRCLGSRLGARADGVAAATQQGTGRDADRRDACVRSRWTHEAPPGTAEWPPRRGCGRTKGSERRLMTLVSLVFRSLRFNARSHAGALLGAAVGTAVLVGALLVGD